jgi:hypothetical protein
MEEAMNAEASGATTFTIYIPPFLQEHSLSGQSLEQQNKELLQRIG